MTMTTSAPTPVADAMNTPAVHGLLRFEPIDLETLNQRASLQTRKDRKYVVSADTLDTLLGALSTDVRCLDVDGQRWFGYESIYFDTLQLDSYRLAATRRPKRFKVRTRTYLDSGTTMAEIKTKNGRGCTVKHRRSLDRSVTCGHAAIRGFASELAETAPYAASLEPVLTTSYRRATLVLPNDGVRFTIDAALSCTDAHGKRTGLPDKFIIETKTSGAPSVIDRLLWRLHHRPEKISKFATGIAALHPELPANRWKPVLRKHFAHNIVVPHDEHHA